MGGLHGTNAGVGSGGGVDTLGERFLNGAAILGITRAQYGTNGRDGVTGACWTKGSVDSVNNCTKGHGGMNWSANYNLGWP
jgi:hypothetical protein